MLSGDGWLDIEIHFIIIKCRCKHQSKHVLLLTAEDERDDNVFPQSKYSKNTQTTVSLAPIAVNGEQKPQMCVK